MDVFCGGHVEHSRNLYIRDLCITLPADEIFLTHPQRSKIEDAREQTKMALNQ